MGGRYVQVILIVRWGCSTLRVIGPMPLTFVISSLCLNVQFFRGRPRGAPQFQVQCRTDTRNLLLPPD